MSRFTRSIRRFAASPRGLSSLELLISLGIISIAMAATSGLFLASRNFMRDQALELETTQAARATIDMLLRELRLAGACLPVTGNFVSLDGTDDGNFDELVSRTGLTRPDLSCVRTTTTEAVVQGDAQLTLDNIDGFSDGMRAYIRHPAGSGEFFTIGSINGDSKTVSFDPPLSADYPAASGFYAIDERRFRINTGETEPILEVEINGNGQPSKLAVGIEQLDVQYQLHRNCPSCDVVDLPADDTEWALVEQLFLTVTARSQRRGPNGEYYQRTIKVGVKPRNLLPRG
jgi:type II secretory pathway pseudopilin PulG